MTNQQDGLDEILNEAEAIRTLERNKLNIMFDQKEQTKEQIQALIESCMVEKKEDRLNIVTELAPVELHQNHGFNQAIDQIRENLTNAGLIKEKK